MTYFKLNMLLGVVGLNEIILLVIIIVLIPLIRYIYRSAKNTKN